MPRGARRRKCDSYKVFEANLNRAQAFLRIFDATQARGQPSGDRKELLRGSVVFAVGALDAFVSDLILEIVPRFGASSTGAKESLKSIAKNDPGLPLRLVLTTSSEDKQAEFRGALAEWLATKSWHGPQKLVEGLDYVDCGIPWSDFDAATNENSARELTRFTDWRHGIVHEGKKPQIHRWRAQQGLDLVAEIATLINASVIDKYY